MRIVNTLNIATPAVTAILLNVGMYNPPNLEVEAALNLSNLFCPRKLKRVTAPCSLRVHDKKVITLLSVRIGAPKNPESVH
jgi:hypothetical protein